MKFLGDEDEIPERVRSFDGTAEADSAVIGSIADELP
jgi:hypothetical protein